MFHLIRRALPNAYVCCLMAALSLSAMSDAAQAKRGLLGAVFSKSRAVAPAIRSAGHTAEEAARTKRVESRIDWSKAEGGIEFAKAAIEVAVESAGTGSSPPPVFSGHALSRFELEACVREANTLDRYQDRYATRETQVQSLVSSIKALELRIRIARVTVDRSSQQSVDEFNAWIAHYNDQVSSLNEIMLPDIERQRITFNRRVHSFNNYCNGKRYYSDDLEAIEAKLGVKM